MELLNQIRGYRFLLGVLRNQQNDPHCGVCSAFANTLKAAQENFVKLNTDHAEELKRLAPDFTKMLCDTQAGLPGVSGPANPSGQKKAGNCKLPQGVCFIKASFALVQQI